MTKNRHERQRKSPRLQGYDYAQHGAYFVTICAHNREHIFGRIHDGDMILSELGQIASTCWNAIPDHFSSVALDVSIIMPNHVHGIIVLPGSGVQLGTVIGNYKAAVTRRIRNSVGTPVGTTVGTPYMASLQTALPMASLPAQIWQARYHDHIIRNEASLERIRAYILNNPARWQEDTFFTM